MLKLMRVNEKSGRQDKHTGQEQTGLQMIRNDKSRQESQWRVCFPNPFRNCEKIYPIQQHKVREIIDDLKGDDNVKRIVIFGSSTRNNCHVGSDVDIYLELENDQKVKLNCTEFSYDLWTNYSVDHRMLMEIEKEGVTVYVK